MSSLLQPLHLLLMMFFLRGKRYLILDRDTKYPTEFRSALARDGIQVIRLPVRSPNLNAFAERFVRSIKSECLNRMIFFGKDSLPVRVTAIHGALPRRAKSSGPRKSTPCDPPMPSRHRCHCSWRQRLGGMLNYYSPRRCLSTSFLILDTASIDRSHDVFLVTG